MTKRGRTVTRLRFSTGRVTASNTAREVFGRRPLATLQSTRRPKFQRCCPCSVR